MPSLHLVANPSASGFTGALFRDVVRALGERYEVTPVWPGSAEGSRLAAEKAAANGVDVVAAMGGDGVVHHVGNGLVGSDTALAVIPAGTTNVIARILGIPVNGRKAAGRLLGEGGPRFHPLPAAELMWEGLGGEGRAHALFAAGVGIDADIVQVAEERPRAKLRFGGLYYARQAVGVLAGEYRRKPANLRVTANGDAVDAVAVLIQIHHTYTYLGAKPLRIVKDPGDGLAAGALPSTDLGTLAAVLPRLAIGKDLTGARKTSVWTGLQRLHVGAEPPVRLQADGEILDVVEELHAQPASEVLLVVS